MTARALPLPTEATRGAGDAKQIAVERLGSMVLIEIKCASDYDAMMLEDRMVEELAAGYVKLEIMTKPRREV